MKLYIYLLIGLFSCFSQQSEEYIIGKWKLISFNAIEKIRNSPAYMLENKSSRELFEKIFQTYLSNAQYTFSKDSLIYTDIEADKIKIKNRRAIWKLEKNILIIKEIDRSFERKAYVHLISKDSLIFSPIIEEEVSYLYKMKFTKVNID